MKLNIQSTQVKPSYKQINGKNPASFSLAVAAITAAGVLSD